MTDHRQEGPGENGAPVPRDLPDQQAGVGDDPWEAASPTREQRRHLQSDRADRDEDAEADGEENGTAEPADDVPDTDEAGTGRQGAPHSGAVHPEHPVPDEPSG
ncbi:hypothetical protein ACFWR9_39995 [Streptomyces sp. NPDC058534]|uniref:hypothetical protein n=1 Tax=Streptomyces sp. NPDC058534 TaxID=3346541 RepID=UPI00364DEB29